MQDTFDQPLLEVLLDSWNRNAAITVNLLRCVPPGGLEVQAMETSPTVAQMFTHMHFVRLVFLTEDAPEFACPLPEHEWMDERDPGRIEQMLRVSDRAVRAAVKTG